MGKFDEEIHDEEQGNDMLDKVAAAAPLQAKGMEKVIAKKEDDEGTTRQNSVYEVPKKWHRLIAESSGASFSSYAKLAIREKLIKDGLL